MSKKKFKPGERVLANYGRAESSQKEIIKPAMYVATYGGFDWVLSESEDISNFCNMDEDIYDPHLEGLLLHPCKEVLPFPKVRENVNWITVKCGTIILVHYVYRAWFAECLLRRKKGQIAVYVDKYNNFVPYEEAVDIVWFPMSMCSIPL